MIWRKMWGFLEGQLKIARPIRGTTGSFYDMFPGQDFNVSLTKTTCN